MADIRETYGDFWDDYVKRFPKLKETLYDSERYGHVTWPGDEWGRPDRWQMLFESMFVQQIKTPPVTAIEIGSGSGKYTHLFLEQYPSARVVAMDVSQSYLNVLCKRFADYIAAGRLTTATIGTKPSTVTDLAKEHGIAPGALDVLYSIDAMVHVDLQYLVAYWMSAQELLKTGGKLIMTVADATREHGFKKLIGDINAFFPAQGRPTSKFEWLSPDLVNHVLGRLGFEVSEAPFPEPRRDYWFVATKK